MKFAACYGSQLAVTTGVIVLFPFVVIGDCWLPGFGVQQHTIHCAPVQALSWLLQHIGFWIWM
jgi:hypothetical protein